MESNQQKIEQLQEQYKDGKLSRRDFLIKVGLIGGTAALASLAASPLFGGRGRASAEEPKTGGTLRVVTQQNPINMDPVSTEATASILVYDHVFDRLIDMNPDGTFRPNLAKSWKQVDELTWEFDLVENAVFHNGEKFTAADVEFTLKRILDPEKPTTVGGFFTFYDKAVPVNDHKVQIVLKKPFGIMETTISSLMQITNEKGIRDNDPKRTPIGTGPFKMTEWVTDDHIYLDRWEQHHKSGKPYADRVHWRWIGDDSVRLTALEVGEIDWTDTVPPKDVERIESEGKINVLRGLPGIYTDYISMTNSRPPFDDKKIRQAVAWAVDKKQISQLVWFGLYPPANEVKAPWSFFHTGVDLYKDAPNVEMAKKLVKESKYPDGADAVFSAETFSEQHRLIGEILKEALAPIGIRLTIERKENSVFIPELIDHKLDIVSVWWSLCADPDNFLTPLAHSQSPWNFSHYKNPKTDELLDAAKGSSDQNKRKELYAEFYKAYQDDTPMIFQDWQVTLFGMQKNVNGSLSYPNLQLHFEDVWLA